MAAPQGILRFPGIQNVQSFSYTLSHGITPGVCQVDIVPQAQVPAEIGVMSIEFGQLRLNFADCILDAASLRRTADGTIISLTIIDRRWRWRYGEITGLYNVRKKDGTVDTETEATPQWLATLLFKAMGEQRYSVAELPNKSRPEIEWISDNPASELAQLAESLGCRVVLGLDGRASLRRMGRGAALPSLPSQQTQDYGIDPPLRPDSLKIIGGPTRYQTKFRLEAVGEDTTGEIKRINDLSYIPVNDGWQQESIYSFGNVVNIKARMLALKTVWRFYRIKCTAESNTANVFTIPKVITSVKELWQILPLESNLVDTFLDNDGVEQPKNPVVEGKFWNYSVDGDNVGLVRIYDEKLGRFSIDEQRGIVMFSNPVLTRSDDGTHEEAELYLTIGHSVKTTYNKQPWRWFLDRPMPGQKLKTGPQIIRRDEMVETKIGVYDGQKLTSVTENNSEIIKEADYHLDAVQQGFQVLRTASMTYAGIIPISPDGAIQQVAWSGGPSGCSTTVGRNTEFSRVVPSWAERRAIERQIARQASVRKALGVLATLVIRPGGPIR